MFNLKELYQETILEYGQNPRNFGKIKKANYQAEGFNPLCGDRYWVYLRIKNGVVKDISFDGSGCLISKASASLMTEILKDKTTKNVDKVFNFFQKLVKGEQTSQSSMVKKELSSLEGAGKLIAFSGICKFPLRIKCALLPWYAAKSAYAQKMFSMS